MLVSDGILRGAGLMKKFMIARPLERLIRDGILAKLADRLLSGRPSRARTVRVTADATGLTVR